MAGKKLDSVHFRQASRGWLCDISASVGVAGPSGAKIVDVRGYGPELWMGFIGVALSYAAARRRLSREIRALRTQAETDRRFAEITRQER